MLRSCAAGRERRHDTSIPVPVRDFLVALAVFFAVFAFAAIDAGPAYPAPAASTLAQTFRQAEDPHPPIIPGLEDPVAHSTLPSRPAAWSDSVANQTQQPATQFAAIGVMALLFAAMSTLTLCLWRHLGRACTSSTPRRGRRVN